jgi:hypothetical protein
MDPRDQEPEEEQAPNEEQEGEAWLPWNYEPWEWETDPDFFHPPYPYHLPPGMREPELDEEPWPA